MRQNSHSRISRIPAFCDSRQNRVSIAHPQTAAMPLLVALDECNCALTKIERLAQIALNYPDIRDAALALILLQCQETDAHVGELNSD